MRTSRTCRLAILFAVLALAAGSFAATAGASVPTKSKPPVKLPGKVNNKGTKTAANGSIEIEADDFYFKPTFVKATAGQTLTVKIENESGTAHTFTVDNQGIDADLAPKSTQTVTIKVPDSGSVRFYCQFHVGSGMQGAVFTKPGGSTGGTTSGGTSSGY